VVDRVLQTFKNKYQIIDIDGARIIFPDGWALVRASNTGPELIVRCEGNTPEALEKIKQELFAVLERTGAAPALSH
jgi:phosphomannomutase/phosphomannomutase/phosphoglucomutase